MKTYYQKLGLLFFLLLMVLSLLQPVVTQAASKKYYSEKQLHFKRKIPATTKIIKIKGNKIYYKTKGQVKSAKITKKSKFYVGNPNLYNEKAEMGYSQYSAKNRSIKWLARTNRKTFLKYAKKQPSNQLIIINGKLIKAFSNLQTYS